MDQPLPATGSARLATSSLAEASAHLVDSLDPAWFLSGATRPGDAVRHVPIGTYPFIVGRRAEASLTLNYRTVSGQHARLTCRQGCLLVEDLQSTNGTFVNGRRVTGPTAIKEEDLIHFAEAPFRIRKQDVHTLGLGTVSENVCDQALALVQFDRLMSHRLVEPHFQPIVELSTGEVLGHEVLGRSRVYGLETSNAMFAAAAKLNLEAELSRLLRWEGIRLGRTIAGRPTLYVNTHPLELADAKLAESFAALRELAGPQQLMLEIHEGAVTDVASLHRLRHALTDHGMGLAFDDFGAGQARLAELVEARPDVLKFDISLVQGIDRAGPERQRMLAVLVDMVRGLGITPLAEGVETLGELQVCSELGFTTVQGFYFGKPTALAHPPNE